MARLATIAPFNFEFDTARFLRAYRSAGCSHAQFYRNDKIEIDPEEALEIVRGAEMVFDSIHGLFAESLDPSSPDLTKRRHSIDVYEREGELASQLGGPMVVVHPSWMNPEGLPVSRPPEAVRVAALQDSMAQLARIGERLGVVYLIENLPGFFPIGHDSRRVAHWVRSLGSPNVRMCFDTGHAHIESGLNGSVAAQLSECLDVIGYVHAHDNNSVKDNHRMPGEGTIDWESAAAVLTERAPSDLPWMLEVFYPESEVEALIREGLADRLTRWSANG